MAASDLSRLTADFARPGRIGFAHSSLGPVAILETNAGRASVALQGAQLVSWIPAGRADVIWMSQAAVPKVGKSLRGGTPVCWPWFGAHPDAERVGAPPLPAHGFVRGARWDLAATAADDQSARVRLVADVAGAADAVGVAPPPLSLAIDIALSSAGVSLALTTRNDGAAPLTITQALHTYFAVGDIGAVEVAGLDGCGFIDTVGGISRHVQEGPVRFAGEVDRIYIDQSTEARTRHLRILDHCLGRAIEIASQGSASAVVWNPWDAKAQRLGDMGEGGWRRMLCVETANAADDAVTIAPGAGHTLVARYAVKNLD